MFVKSFRTSRPFATLEDICKETRISRRHIQKRCGVVTPHQIYLFGRKRLNLPYSRLKTKYVNVDKFSARLAPRPIRSLRTPSKEIDSARASPDSRASRAFEGNRLVSRLARFARFARFGRESAQLMPRPISSLRAPSKESGSARASPFSRASRALDLQLRLIVCAQIKS